MKTLHNTINLSGASNFRKQVRLALTLIGIVAAIICLYTLLHDMRSLTPVATIFQRTETSKILSADLLIKMNNLHIVSAIWPLK